MWGADIMEAMTLGTVGRMRCGWKVMMEERESDKGCYCSKNVKMAKCLAGLGFTVYFYIWERMGGYIIFELGL